MSSQRLAISISVSLTLFLDNSENCFANGLSLLNNKKIPHIFKIRGTIKGIYRGTTRFWRRVRFKALGDTGPLHFKVTVLPGGPTVLRVRASSSKVIRPVSAPMAFHLPPSLWEASANRAVLFSAFQLLKYFNIDSKKCKGWGGYFCWMGGLTFASLGKLMGVHLLFGGWHWCAFFRGGWSAAYPRFAG